MFRALALLCLCVTCLFFVGCDITGGPDAVAQQFQEELTPYFPNAEVKADPDKHVIMALSCLTGTGPLLAGKVGDVLQNDPQMAKLKKLRSLGPILGSPTYKYVLLGFDTSVVRFDVDEWSVETLEIPNGYDGFYRKECHLPEPRNWTEPTSHEFVIHPPPKD
ncbi:MAG: hypothetical protein ACJ71W_05955 [Terriglobales bacterium]